MVDIVPRLSRGELSEHGRNLYHFVDVVLGRAKPVFLPAQGVDMIRILSALYASAETGQEVRLD